MYIYTYIYIVYWEYKLVRSVQMHLFQNKMNEQIN